MSITPYRAISRAPHGSFEWAMNQLRAGNEVRREHWPIEVWPEPPPPGWSGVAHWTRIWHLYSSGDGTTTGTICKGFQTGIVGADNDSWGDLGMDSGVWTPTLDDTIALDWQRVTDVGDEQIRWLDANRTTRHPREPIAADRQSAQPSWGWVILMAAIAAAICWLVIADEMGSPSIATILRGSW